MRFVYVFSVTLAISSTCSFGASFDCRKASTFAEKAICSDAKLSKLDDLLSENFKSISAADIGDGARKDLKATQRAWLAMRNKCTSNECLTSHYKQRIDAICDYPVLSGAHPPCASSDAIETNVTPPKSAIQSATITATPATNTSNQQQIGIDEADLRTGKAKPTNLRQAAIAFGAENGKSLASAPKIRPDGKMYSMYGIIEKAENAPEFIAYSSESQLVEGVALAARIKGSSTNYFKVKIPKALQAAYFESAKIGGGFDLVGRYVENIAYKTVVGQEKSAPVFEAVYFVMWK